MGYANEITTREQLSQTGDERACTVLLSASSISGDDVYNVKDEKLGAVKDLMLDVDSGTIRYAVLSFGGFLGLGDKLFAVPWKALKLDTAKKRFVLDVETERLKNAPGFDKDHWPDMADSRWSKSIHSYYDTGATVLPNFPNVPPR
jgi:sporulation protein YlmC with PRC-barrel domain